jgi:hypothetical protein
VSPSARISFFSTGWMIPNARPIDVYRLEGAAPMIEAIRAFEQGAFA